MCVRVHSFVSIHIFDVEDSPTPSGNCGVHILKSLGKIHDLPRNVDSTYNRGAWDDYE